MAEKFKAAGKAVQGAVKMASANAECVKVVVRCRPLSSKEVDDGRQRIVDMDLKSGQISIKNPKGGAEPPKIFSFDKVYDWNTIQINLYNESARPIVESVMSGYNGTVFAYGQTGTGKSHTMEGCMDPPELRGIIPNTFEQIFEDIKNCNDKDFLVRASYLEIYNEEIRDLLAKNAQNRLELKETPDSGVYVKDLTNFVVKGVKELTNVLAVGKKNRSVGATLMNQDSSRSHSIFCITIETSDRNPISEDGGHIRVGKLNLVDLAGSERQSKTGATGDRLKEATKINLSLSALGNVISSLVDGKSGHIPYRDSKLTRLLQDSLGGNTKTVMCANIGPADYNFDETISTLRYANRAKNIKNKPRVNEDPKDAMLKEFQDEINRLKAQIGEGGGAAAAPAPALPPKIVEKKVVKEVSDETKASLKEKMRKEMEASVRESIKGEVLSAAKTEIEAEVEKQRAEVEQEKQRENEEKELAEMELQEKQAAIEEQRAAVEKERLLQEQLAKKLKAMESQVLHGDGENLIEKTEGEEEELRRIEDEKRAQREEEEEAARRIAELEEMNLMADEKFSSVQEETEVKTKKIKKMWTKYQETKAEVQDLQEEFQREREILLDDIRQLTREMKLKNLIIDSFIPPEELEKIHRRSMWDEHEDTWQVERLPYAGNHVRARRTAELVKQRKEQGGEVQIPGAPFSEADLEYVGYDMNGVPVDARMQQAIKAAFEQEGGMVVNASEALSNVYFSYTEMEEGAVDPESGEPTSARPKSARPKKKEGVRASSARPKSGRPSTASRKAAEKEKEKIGKLSDEVANLEEDNSAANFPKARGMVKDKSRR